MLLCVSLRNEQTIDFVEAGLEHGYLVLDGGRMPPRVGEGLGPCTETIAFAKQRVRSGVTLKHLIEFIGNRVRFSKDVIGAWIHSYLRLVGPGALSVNPL